METSLILQSDPMMGEADSLRQRFSAAKQRREATISLTANENVLSESARWVGQSRHYDRYYFNGLLNDDCRYAAHYNGMQFEAFPEVAWLQAEATAAAQRLFDAPYIEYRALSGVHCTLAMIAALTEPGDGVWSLSPACGGHFATAALVERLGRCSGFITLTDDGEIDLAALASMLRQPPAAVVLDHGLTCHGFAVAPLRQWLDRHGLTEVLILYDASHPLGLIAGGALANPLDDGADILQGNTHKSFPGPHRAIIATRNASLAARIQGGLDAGLVSSPNLPCLLQLFVTLREMACFGADYARQMCRNAWLLGERLADLPGWTVLPTQTHMLLLQGEQSAAAAAALNELGIRVNNKMRFGQPCLRLGLQEVTRLGISDEQLGALSDILRQALLNPTNDRLRPRVQALGMQLRQVHYSFDTEGR
ncbi:Pyridoxal-phosphate-dependent serine hydroxymethyltransferase [Serratia rubidaea]|uniref:hypothetical protein n=2 Tax=Serratia rubidaea TaxID=61652 RepID=UPI00078960AB|nr:hypothetical protein [Serratia rubidaea]QPR63836.1 hypothetical protein I6G83_00805 [Serratia rubidaea]CAI1051217.1 Pyridoxal-phosphate-dependent serine hydroxymethyltransferase [Serratia rubidaea]CAI1816754.1 Pyridoxal-phosphate-dependent serine hydroxymethyltransferase [Serratia rubidaea]HAY0637993.1 hypothetical protein [Serratia rubidaea]